MNKRDAIVKVKEKLNTVRSVALISGSGISAESGVPTFRGKDGLWKTYRAQDLANPRAFQSNPELVWEWYNWRRSIIDDKKPNPAHYACVELEKSFGENFLIITQNVDGLHKLAGNNNVLEIHGNIWQTRCNSCGEIKENKNKLSNLPHCDNCGGLLRPNVIWFGESLDENVLLKSFQAMFSSEMVFVVGTSGIVYPAAQFAGTAKSNGAYVVEINLDETPNSDIVDLSIRGKAGEILPAIASIE